MHSSKMTWSQRVGRLASAYRAHQVLTRVAGTNDATFWLTVGSVRNLSVKEYEDPDMGNSAMSGLFHLTGTLHVKPRGANWDAPFPVNHRIQMSQHAQSGTMSLSPLADDPVAQLLAMAVFDSNVENVITKALGKLTFVPYRPRSAAGIPNKMQVLKLMQQHSIPGEVSGAGAKWQVELPDEKARKKFEKVVPGLGGYQTGYGAWVLKPGYESKGDYNDPSSAWHYASRQAALPPGFTGFKDTRPHKPDPDAEVRHKLETLNHGMAETRAAHTFLAPAGLKHLVTPAVLYWSRRAWSVQVEAPNKPAAERLGRTIQKNLLPKKALTAADPYLYELPLFVRFADGFVEIPGLVPRAPKEPGQTGQADLKARVKQTGEAFFGAGSVGIAGKDGAYVLRISPKLKAHQGLFRETVVRGATVAEVGEKLDQAISKVQEFLARK